MEKGGDAREERGALGFRLRGKEVVVALVDAGKRRMADACGTPRHGRRTGVQRIGEQEGGRRRVGEAGWVGLWGPLAPGGGRSFSSFLLALFLWIRHFSIFSILKMRVLMGSLLFITKHILFFGQYTEHIY